MEGRKIRRLEEKKREDWEMGTGGDCLNRGLHGLRGLTLSDGQWLMTVETAEE